MTVLPQTAVGPQPKNPTRLQLPPPAKTLNYLQGCCIVLLAKLHRRVFCFFFCSRHIKRSLEGRAKQKYTRAFNSRMHKRCTWPAMMSVNVKSRGKKTKKTIYSSHDGAAIADLMLQKFVWLNMSTPVIWKTFNIACHFSNGPLKTWK